MYMPVCLYIFLLVFQFACENFFPNAFLFHFFLSNFAPFVPSSLHCVDVSLPLSTLLPIHRSLYPSSCSFPFFFVLVPFPLSIPSSPLFSFSPPLLPLLCSFSLFLPLVLPFPLLFSPFSFPYPSSTTSFFFSLSLPPALSPFFSVLSPSLRHSVSVYHLLPLCSCALFPCVLPSNILCSLSTSPSSCLFSMFSRLFLFTLFRFSCAGVYAILSRTLSYHRRLPYASFIFVNFIALSLELLSLLSVQRLARLSASRLFFYLFKLSSSSMTHYFILLHSSLPLVVLR